MILKKFDNSVLYIIISGYLNLHTMILLFNGERNFLTELDYQVKTITVLCGWAICCFLLFCIDQFTKITITRQLIFIVSFSIYLLIFSLQSSSSLPIFGGLLLFLALLMYLIFQREDHYQLVAMTMFVIAILGIIKLNFSLSGDNEKFQIILSSADQQLLLTGIIVIIFGILFSLIFDYRIINKYKWIYYLIMAVFIIQIGYLICLVCHRIVLFHAPNFDMGIFSQMFANMAKGLGPVTTVERDRYLSHFSVHLSPIHYVLLPLYWIWPSPMTIQVSQVLIVASGVLPLYLILNQLHFSSKMQVLLIGLYLFTPTLTTGHFYDYHENSFLAPLILWVFWAILHKKIIGMLITTLGLLMVKEDAVVYVVSLGIFFLLQKEFEFSLKIKYAIVLIHVILPIIYFSCAMYWLETHGDGAMTSRFANFMLEGQTRLVDAVINAMKNPSYVLASLFTYQKLKYVVVILLSQAFLPLFQREWIHYVLFLPLIVINLLSDWPYQVDFFKQYHYGTSTLIFLLSVLSLHHLLKDKTFNRHLPKLLTVALLVSISFWSVMIMPYHRMIEEYRNNKLHYQSIQTTLDAIPRDGEMLSVSQYITPLSNFTYLYDTFYHNDRLFDPKIKYVVYERQMQFRDAKENEVVQQYLDNGYVESNYSSEFMVVLEAPQLD